MPSESMSPPSSLNMHSYGDEIVVGARTNGTHDAQTNDGQQPEQDPANADKPMDDAPNSRPSSSRYTKRTRSAAQNDPSPEDLSRLANAARESYETLASARHPRRVLPDTYERGVVLGWWRDSPVEDERYKHAIVATLDSKGRVRPRIQSTNIHGQPINAPVPSGPGGTEVAFTRIVFLEHLIGLRQAHIVEYVKYRAAMVPADHTDLARTEADLDARAKADRSIKAYPPAELGPIAYGREVPEDVVTPLRPEPTNKRRRTDGGFVPIDRTPLPDPAMIPSTAIDMEPLYGTRPTRILVGYWKGSSEEDPRDRHAIEGILGSNDMFRVKVVRETRDGRPVTGNFPTGAGALWVHYDDVELEDHLKGLNRNEIKEYVRIRQYFADRGERPEDRAVNEAVAVVNAQRRVLAGFKGGPTAGVPEPSLASAGARGDAVVAEMMNNYYNRGKAPPPPKTEPRPKIISRRSLGSANELPERQPPVAERIFPAEPVAYRTERPSASREASRQAASREAAAMAAASAANTHLSLSPLPSHSNVPHGHTQAHPHPHPHPHPQTHTHTHTPTPTPTHPSHGANTANPRMRFHDTDEMQRLNDIWARQEAQRQRGSEEETKVYGDTRYVRKGAGPFQGRYVADTRKLITIDGEDYVEYRVLAKTM